MKKYNEYHGSLVVGYVNNEGTWSTSEVLSQKVPDVNLPGCLCNLLEVGKLTPPAEYKGLAPIRKVPANTYCRYLTADPTRTYVPSHCHIQFTLNKIVHTHYVATDKKQHTPTFPVATDKPYPSSTSLNDRNGMSAASLKTMRHRQLLDLYKMCTPFRDKTRTWNEQDWSDSFNKKVGVLTQEVTHLNGSSHTVLTVEVHPTPTTTEIKRELVYITPQHEMPHHFSHTSCCLNDAIKGDGRGNHINGTMGQSPQNVEKGSTHAK